MRAPWACLATLQLFEALHLRRNSANMGGPGRAYNESEDRFECSRERTSFRSRPARWMLLSPSGSRTLSQLRRVLFARRTSPMPTTSSGSPGCRVDIRLRVGRICVAALPLFEICFLSPIGSPKSAPLVRRSVGSAISGPHEFEAEDQPVLCPGVKSRCSSELAIHPWRWPWRSGARQSGCCRPCCDQPCIRENRTALAFRRPRRQAARVPRPALASARLAIDDTTELNGSTESFGKPFV